jgi:diadenosine tetraphosphatase ApaH/serine/threonine PP2A family protein phosphatase
MNTPCTRCQGSGIDPQFEVQIRDIDTYWRCKKCGTISNFEPVNHVCDKNSVRLSEQGSGIEPHIKGYDNY